MRLQGIILRPASSMLCQVPVLVWKREWGRHFLLEKNPFWVDASAYRRSAFAHDGDSLSLHVQHRTTC